MILKNGPIKLTNREYKVMDILWSSAQDLTIHEISELSDDPKLTVACVAQVMPRLLKKELVHIEKFVSANTKYARTFLADISREDYTNSELRRLFCKADIKAMLSALVQANNSDENAALFRDLETFIQEYKRTEKG